MDWGLVIPALAAFVGGSAFSKIIEMIGDRWHGATVRRRAEVDAIAKQLAEAKKAETESEAAEAEAARDRRIALELLSATRRIALDYGVPLEVLPPVDLGGG